jgi:hypothetical protein
MSEQCRHAKTGHGVVVADAAMHMFWARKKWKNCKTAKRNSRWNAQAGSGIPQV